MNETVPAFITWYFRIIAVVTAVMGGFLIVWPAVISIFFDTIDPGTTFLARIVGSTLLGYAVLNGLTAQRARNKSTYRISATANLATLVVALLICTLSAVVGDIDR